jgi:hypothetical protein
MCWAFVEALYRAGSSSELDMMVCIGGVEEGAAIQLQMHMKEKG